MNSRYVYYIIISQVRNIRFLRNSLKNQTNSIFFLIFSFSAFLYTVLAEELSDIAAIARLKHDLAFLCSPELAGRNAPGLEADRTADWIAARMRSLNLKPAFDGSYHQEAPVSSGLIDTVEGVKFIVYTGERTDTLEWGDEFLFVPTRLCDIATAGEIICCGYGLSIPDKNRNDYANLKSGAVAAVLAGSDAQRNEIGPRSAAAFKAAASQRAGAVMLIVVYADTISSLRDVKELDDKFKQSSEPIYDLAHSEAEFPVVYCRSSELANIVKKHSLGSDSLNNRYTLDIRAALSITFKSKSPLRTYNIAGYFPGANGRIVIIGAHYDHLGRAKFGGYYPGADDNASGITGMLELARRWQDIRMAWPGASIYFVAFSCEEDGLLGSKYFCQHLPFLEDSLVAMVNVDMIGRDGYSNMRDVGAGKTPPEGYLAGYYSAGAPKLGEILKKIAGEMHPLLALNVQPVNSFRHFGDAAPFHNLKIPTAHIFSGFHSDYHQISDRPEKINFTKMNSVILALYLLTIDLTSQPAPIGFDAAIQAPGTAAPY